MSRRHVYWVAAFLALVSISLFLYKVLALGFPLTSGRLEPVWDLEMQVRFEASGRPVKVTLALPASAEGYAVVDESFVSEGYGLTTRIADQGRIAVWSRREAGGTQILYYRAVIQQLEAGREPAWTRPPEVRLTDLDESEFAAAYALFSEALERSADLETLVPQLMRLLASPEPDSATAALVGPRPTGVERLEAAVTALAIGEIPARVVRGVELERRRRRAPVATWLEVFDNDEWSSFDSSTGERQPSEGYLPLARGAPSLVRVAGGESVQLTPSVRRSEAAGVRAATARSQLLNPAVLRFSLVTLPIQTQEVYRVLLLVPVGAFLLVLLRGLVGIRTFGTFMPVLIALAFRETELVWGLVLFTLVVALGLAVRFYLEKLKLLFVPRLAAVLTVVVLLLLLLSVASHLLGLERGLSVALFPMVILTITIERMSVVWEERGATEALQQGLGSLVVAALAYFVMASPLVGHLIFVFPELLLLLLAGTLLMGCYTGYRLIEYWRFKVLREASE